MIKWLAKLFRKPIIERDLVLDIPLPIKAGRYPDAYCRLKNREYFDWKIFDGFAVRYQGRPVLDIFEWDVYNARFVCGDVDEEKYDPIAVMIHHFYFSVDDTPKMYVDDSFQEIFDTIGIKAEEWETWTDFDKAHLRLLLP